MNKIFENINLKDINWLASHPIAGTEESGPSAGFKIYSKIDGQLSSDDQSKNINKEQLNKIKKFWEFLGSKVKLMNFKDHDCVLSLTSHMPHAM